MTQIDIKTSQLLILDIAKIVKDIAERHNIPFFMVGGTMLGAIRHKGFIPWDDDMDFGVTYDNFWKLSDYLKQELPSRYKCITYEDRELVTSFFYKVVDTQTCIDDPCYNIPLEEKMGLAIDIFPIVSCTEKEGSAKTQRIFKLWMKSRKVYTPSASSTLSKSLAKAILRLITRQKPYDFCLDIKEIVDSISPGDKYCNIVSPQFWRIMWPEKVFKELTYYKFEDTELLGPKEFDKYLTQCYKDYMKLPPLEKRRVHADTVYIK